MFKITTDFNPSIDERTDRLPDIRDPFLTALALDHIVAIVPKGLKVGGKAFIAELESLGYDGNYVIEREGGKKRVADIRQAIAALVD